MRVSLIPVSHALVRTPITLREATDAQARDGKSDAEWLSLTINEQIACRLKALRGLTFLLLDGALSAYIWAPSNHWFRVPKGYWHRDGFTFHDVIERVGFADQYWDSEPFLDAPPDLEGQPFVVWSEDLSQWRSEVAKEDLFRRGTLPSRSTKSHRDHESAAHNVARLLQSKTCRSVAAGIQLSLDCVDGNNRTDDSIARAIRNAYDLMYDLRGDPRDGA